MYMCSHCMQTKVVFYVLWFGKFFFYCFFFMLLYNANVLFLIFLIFWILWLFRIFVFLWLCRLYVWLKSMFVRFICLWWCALRWMMLMVVCRFKKKLLFFCSCLIVLTILFQFPRIYNTEFSHVFITELLTHGVYKFVYESIQLDGFNCLAI